MPASVEHRTGCIEAVPFRSYEAAYDPQMLLERRRPAELAELMASGHAPSG